MRLYTILVFFWTLSAWAEFSVVHYNIKELETHKLTQKNQQIDAAVSVLEKFPSDILSINEMQYDLPGVPTSGADSKGKNAERLAHKLGMDDSNIVFYQANTGNRARPRSNGDYVSSQAGDYLDFADVVNFGLFPGQYSTAAITKFKILDKKVYHSLAWKKFNPYRNLRPFRNGDGSKLPSSIELFDKNFTDILVEIEGRPVHLIFFHTVPAFGFGNAQTPNKVRNADQLRFLEWYLSGETDFYVPKLRAITPLKAGATFIAVGDWNVDVKSDLPGAKVLKRLLQKYQIVHDTQKPTYIGMSFAPQGFSSTLDYMLTSHDLRVLKGGVYHPKPLREELGCDQYMKVYRPEKVLVEYKKEGKNCRAYISKEFYEVKTASDHLLMWAELDFK